MPRLVPALVAAAAWLPAALAHAGGLDLDSGGPRAVGRAGANLVSDDGTAALLQNPAGMARRDRLRFQLGTSVLDADSEFRTADESLRQVCVGDPLELGSPDIDDRGGPVTAPQFGAQGGFGRFVFGAAYIETGDSSHVLARPVLTACGGNELRRVFPHRYGGTGLRFQRRAFVAGAAARVTSWLGVGLSVSASQVSLREQRTVWAGFTGIDELGDPVRDLALELNGRDLFVPGATASAFLAPPELPLEAVLAVGVNSGARLRGTVALNGPPMGFPTTVFEVGANSRLRLPTQMTVRAGARYLGERFVAELTGEVMLYPGAHAREDWRVRGVAVVDGSSVIASLATVPGLVTFRPHGAVRLGGDYELLQGFLWLTGGYAYATAGVEERYLNPAQVDLASHTMALGLEAIWGELTFTVGYSRAFSFDQRVDDTAVQMVNPFDGGSGPAANGRYSRGADLLGLSMELTWPDPQGTADKPAP